MTTGFFSHPDCLLHEMGEWHPECPARLQAIEDQLIASRIDALVERDESAPLATEAELLRVHTQAHIDFIRNTAPIEGYASIDPDTLMNPHTWQAALRAAGAAIAATDAVLAGRYENAFCSVRPPGNGTEAAFAGDSRVLMCSFFQHPFYPYSGAENPAPNMVNLPIAARTKGMEVREAIDIMWLPRLHEFKPEMVFVSAGFDAHREDDLGNMGLVEDDFAWITEQIRTIAGRYAKGRIVSCLEGGYNLSALGRSVVAHLRVLADI